MKKKYIYGLDLSMADTGIVIFDENNPVYINNIKTNNKETHGKRLKQIYDFMLDLKKKYPPSIICIERGFSRFNTSTAVLYKVHGVINMVFYDIEQIYYPPKKIKETVLKGNATKIQIMNKILQIYPNIDFKNDNESDAFAVVLTYLVDKKGDNLINAYTQKK